MKVIVADAKMYREMTEKKLSFGPAPYRTQFPNLFRFQGLTVAGGAFSEMPIILRFMQIAPIAQQDRASDS